MEKEQTWSRRSCPIALKVENKAAYWRVEGSKPWLQATCTIKEFFSFPSILFLLEPHRNGF